MTAPTAALAALVLREADAHDYFADNEDLRMTTGDHAKRAAKLREIAEALAALPASGWVLVPREPTPKMIDAAMQREDTEPLSDWGKIVAAPHDEIYRAMIAAAPTPGEPK